MTKYNYHILFVCLIFTAIGGCNSSEKEFTEKKYTIPDKGSVHIRELGLTITNDGCGREWYNTDGEHASERPFCDLQVKYKDSTRSFRLGFEEIYFGEAQITVEKINPWGREQDSVPPGGCRLLVRRTEPKISQ